MRKPISQLKVGDVIQYVAAQLDEKPLGQNPFTPLEGEIIDIERVFIPTDGFRYRVKTASGWLTWKDACHVYDVITPAPIDKTDLGVWCGLPDEKYMGKSLS